MVLLCNGFSMVGYGVGEVLVFVFVWCCYSCSYVVGIVLVFIHLFIRIHYVLFFCFFLLGGIGGGEALVLCW